jgi:hypothetical protein
MAPRLALYFPPTDEMYDLDPCGEVVVGTSQSCTLNVRQHFGENGIHIISRRHFKIVFVKGEGFAICDLNSLNGTRVNGQRLQPGCLHFLKDSDTIVLAENPSFTIEVISDNYGITEPVTFPIRYTLDEPMEMAPTLFYLSLEDGQFVLEGAPISHEYLTALEHKLLEYLYDRSGRVCTYEEMVHNVWGYDRYDDVQDNAVAKLVSNLRKKLDALSPGAGMRHIHTVHGRGFKFMPM